jgi:hypothetical protein
LHSKKLEALLKGQLAAGKVGFGPCTSRHIIILNNYDKPFNLSFRTGGISCYNEGKVCRLIIASLVLHNICIAKEIPLTQEDEEYRDNFIIPHYLNHPYDNLSDRQSTTLANANRERIARAVPV